MNAKTMVLRPRVSEKAYGLSEKLNTYVFEVPTTANKSMVAAAVEEQFSVTVVGMKVIVVKGKPKKSYQKGNRPVAGTRAKGKKMYVRLKEGDSINVFGEVEDDKKAKKEDKKAVKKAVKKETK